LLIVTAVELPQLTKQSQLFEVSESSSIYGS